MSKAAELAKWGEVSTNGQVSGRRNIVINGAMQVAQRATSGVSSASGGALCVDRFKGYSNGGGVFSLEQSSTVPDNEFAYSTKLTVTTADSSIAAADYFSFNQLIEGYNTIQTGYGTADAKVLSLSFWVRSSVTGKYSLTCYNSDGSRGYLNTFTIATADTWQKINLSWAGDTGGTWLKTNGNGITIRIDLGGGSNGNGTANQWTTSGSFAANRTSDSVSWIATGSATFFITGVQLEVGSVATPFEHRSFGEELQLCQRYLFKDQDGSGAAYKRYAHGGASATTVASCSFTIPTPLRAVPTLVLSGNVNTFLAFSAGATDALTGLVIATDDDAGTFNRAVELTATVGSGLVAGEQVSIISNNSTSTFISLDAEL